jgi:hypothetical protein
MPTDISVAVERRLTAENAEKANTHLVVLILPLLFCSMSLGLCLALPDFATAVIATGTLG